VAHAERLEQALPDLKPPYTPGQAVTEANRCLYCHDAPCVAACPTGIDIPGFIRKIATGNLKGSARTILSANLLGYSCARVCPVEVLCAGACVHQHQGHATIAIGRLQRQSGQGAFDRGEAATLAPREPRNGHQVTPVPEPSQWAMMLAGLALVGFMARRNARSQDDAR